MADSASSSRAVMAQSAPTSLPTACSVSVARSACMMDPQPVSQQLLYYYTGTSERLGNSSCH